MPCLKLNILKSNHTLGPLYVPWCLYTPEYKNYSKYFLLIALLYLFIPSQENLSFSTPTTPPVNSAWSHRHPSLLCTSSLTPPSAQSLTTLALGAFYFLVSSLASNPIVHNAAPLLFLKLDPFVYFVSKSPKHLSPWGGPIQPPACTPHTLYSVTPPILCTCSFSSAYIHASQMQWIIYKNSPISCGSILLETQYKLQIWSHI